MKVNCLIFLLCFSLAGYAQGVYSTANAHSHNDYEKPFPFWQAWQAGFGSVEADIFLHHGQLLVAHDSAQLQRRWTLDSLYLQPLALCIERNGGSVYADTRKELQLMIDIKSDSVATLAYLVERIKAFPSLTTTPSLKIVISGNRPDPATFASYPPWIFFDGDLRKSYTPEQLERVVMLSGNFKHYATWNGNGKIKADEKERIRQLINKAHRLHKKIRFWNAPDSNDSWHYFVKEKVDFINTDRIAAISAFFSQPTKKMAGRR